MDYLRSTFSKNERLCSKKAIAELFDKGRSFYCLPFQVIWMEASDDLPAPAQMAVSVSKKSFKRAVKRNLIKRRIRESYRKQKHILYEFLEKEKLKIIFILIFKGEIIPEYSITEKSVKDSVDKLITYLQKDSGKQKQKEIKG